MTIPLPRASLRTYLLALTAGVVIPVLYFAAYLIIGLDDLRILVVDDDPDAVDLAASILSAAGAVVSTCRSAAEALASVQQWRPDVLVGGIDMPGEDGYSLIRKVRALDAGRGRKTLVAVALTAHGRPQDRMLALTAGYATHVQKPVDPREFTTIIAGVAGRRSE